MVRNHALTVRVEEAMDADLTRCAETLGLRKADVVRLAIKEWLADCDVSKEKR